MSHEKLHQEAIRWYRQGLDDLEAAQALIAAKKFAQACFYAQPSAEKSLKACGLASTATLGATPALASYVICQTLPSRSFSRS